MIAPLILDGITYDRAAIEEVRQGVIRQRDTTLRHLAISTAEGAVVLSHAVALLTHLRNNTERQGVGMASMQENEE